MPPFLQFLVRRIFAMLASLVVITMVLYAGVMLTPPEARARLYGLGGASAWGILLSLGRNWVIGPGGNLLSAWWVFLPITIAIVLFGIGWNLIGDGLTEALDPTATLRKWTRSDAS
jgi:peptide/nickel transport system permease protein